MTLRRFTSFFAAFFLGILGIAGAVFAAPIEKDLSNGLAYLRTNDPKADAETVRAALAKPALVLDLRETTAPLPDDIRNIIQNKAQPRPLWFVLISPGTSSELIATFSTGRPGVLTIGARSPMIAPDIAAETTPEQDRLAYQALAQGTAVEKLLNPISEKMRHDEAALVREHTNGSDPNTAATSPDETERTEPTTSDPAPVNGTAADKKTVSPAPPLIDTVLLRAVQLHQTLRVMKKL